MTDKKIMQIIHDTLQHKSRWYLDPYAPDNTEYQDIAEKAKNNADYELTRLSPAALLGRYRRWRASDPLIGDKHYFHAFLSQVAFDIGIRSLAKEEKSIFNELCYINIKFI